MTPDQLREAGIQITGERWHWKPRLADLLGVTPRQVYRWMSGETPISERVELAIKALQEAPL